MSILMLSGCATRTIAPLGCDVDYGLIVMLSERYPGHQVTGAQKDRIITEFVRDIRIDNTRKEQLIEQLEKCK